MRVANFRPRGTYGGGGAGDHACGGAAALRRGDLQPVLPPPHRPPSPIRGLDHPDRPGAHHVAVDAEGRHASIDLGYETCDQPAAELRWSAQIDGLQLASVFSSAGRRLLSLEVRCGGPEVGVEDLLGLAVGALDGLRGDAIGDDLAVNQYLALRSAAIVLASCRGSHRPTPHTHHIAR